MNEEQTVVERIVSAADGIKRCRQMADTFPITKGKSIATFLLDRCLETHSKVMKEIVISNGDLKCLGIE